MSCAGSRSLLVHVRPAADSLEEATKSAIRIILQREINERVEVEEPTRTVDVEDNETRYPVGTGGGRQRLRCSVEQGRHSGE